MKLTLSIIFDTAFSLFLSFVLSLTLFSAFTPHPVNVVVACCTSLIFALVTFKLLSARQTNRFVKRARKKAFETTMTNLNLMTKAQTIDFFYKLFYSLDLCPQKIRGGISLDNGNVFLFFKLGFSPVSKTDIVTAYNLKPNNGKVYVLSETFPPDIIPFALRFNSVILVDGKKIFSYLEKHNHYPPTVCEFDVQPKPKLLLLKTLLNKKKSKTYAFFGITFIFMSPFVPIKLYYLIIGCVFLIFALTCLLFGKTEN